MAVFIKKVNIPQKSDLINIDMTGSGTAQTYRIIKKISDDVVEVLAMEDVTTSQFGSSNIYEGSILDAYCNTTLYGTLSEIAKSAIVDKTFRQEEWSNAGNPLYVMARYNASAVNIGPQNTTYGNEITRHCYIIGMQDIIDYLETTPQMTESNTTLNYTNIWQMFWNTSIQPSDKYVWLNDSGTYNTILRVIGNNGSINGSSITATQAVRPAFQIDLSKIDYTFTDGRQPVELKPVSILQKSNNALSRVGMSWKQIVYPNKSDIVNIDMRGYGITQQYRILKNVSGSIYEVLGMSNLTTSTFGTSQTYANGTLDTYLNNTWYNTLSSTAKTAIVDKTFRQDSWYKNNSGNPVYVGALTSNSYNISLSSASFGAEITRHIYALRLQDIIDYLEVTPQMTASDTTLTDVNVWQMFWDSSSQQTAMFIGLCSAQAGATNYVLTLNGTYGNFGSNTYGDSTQVRPAFQIDLSKIDFTIE